MAFDIEMIKKVYAGMGERTAAARTITGKPLTLAEMISPVRGSEVEGP